MRIMHRVGLLIVAFLVLTTITVKADELEFVLEGIKYNDSLLKNYGVRCSYIVEITDNPKGVNTLIDWKVIQRDRLKEAEKHFHEYAIIIKGEKKKIEGKEYEYSQENERDLINLYRHYLLAYDGDKTRTINYNHSKDDIRLSGSLKSEVPFQPFPLPLSFEDLSSRRLSMYSEIKLIKKTQLAGYECYLLEGYNIDDKIKDKLWVAPEIGFRPIRIEADMESGEIIKVMDYEKYNGIWAIKHQKIQNFIKQPNSSDKIEISERKLTVKKAEFICAPDEIPDSVFDLEFPPNTETIWDGDKEEFIDVMPSGDKVDTEMHIRQNKNN